LARPPTREIPATQVELEPQVPEEPEDPLVFLVLQAQLAEPVKWAKQDKPVPPEIQETLAEPVILDAQVKPVKRAPPAPPAKLELQAVPVLKETRDTTVPLDPRAKIIYMEPALPVKDSAALHLITTAPVVRTCTIPC